MALTRDVEHRLRNHLQTVGIENFHDSDRDVMELFAAIGRAREALNKRQADHEIGILKSCSDHTALAVIRDIRRALEGEA